MVKKLYQNIGELWWGTGNIGVIVTPLVTKTEFIYRIGLMIIQGKDPKKIVPIIIEE